jgi:hypothetical protein
MCYLLVVLVDLKSLSIGFSLSVSFSAGTPEVEPHQRFDGTGRKWSPARIRHLRPCHPHIGLEVVPGHSSLGGPQELGRRARHGRPGQLLGPHSGSCPSPYSSFLLRSILLDSIGKLHLAAGCNHTLLVLD